MVNSKDVAKLAGVSTSTVSNILNNTRDVSIEKVERVKHAIEKLGYKTNATARSLKTKITNNIGVILPNITDPNFSLIFTSIERVISENGYSTSLYITSEIPEKENNIIEQIQQNRVEGALIVTCQPENIAIFEQLEKSNIKLVFIEREVKSKVFNFVEYNNYSSIYEFTTKLINFGFTDIVLIAGPKEYSCEYQCINGFTDAAALLVKNNKNILIRETNFDKESTFRIIMEILRENFIPQAIIVTSTQILEGVLEAIHILENYIVKKPAIISLAEYTWSNNYRLNLEAGHHILRIQRRSIELGEKAAEILIDNLKLPLMHENIHLKINNIVPEEDFGLKKEPVKIRSKIDNIKVLMLKSPASKAITKLLPYFEYLYGIKVSIDTFPIIELYEKINTEASKNNYDVFQIDVPWLPEFIEEGYLLELDKFIKDHPEAIEGFTSVVLEKYSKYKNKYFALPYAFDAQLLFYRKDLFEDIVIKRKFKNIYQTELKPPKTWKEFNVIAKFFTKHFNPDSPIDYGTTILGAHFPLAGILCEFLPRMWEYEGKTIDISGNIFMKERADIKGLENYIESFKYASPNSVENDWDEEVGEFCKGRAAMMCLFVAHATDITDRSKSEVVGKIGYDIIPGGIPVLGGWSLGININSNNRETAFDFIKWATSKEFAIPYTILGGFTPRIDLFKSSDLSTLYPWLSKALESFSLSRERSVLKVKTGRKISERDFENIYGKAIIKSIKKQLTPEKAIKEVQHEIIKLITKK